MSNTWIGLLDELASVGLSKADLDKAVGESPTVRAEVIRKAEATKNMWQQVWDGMGEHPYQSGAYRDSFTVTYQSKPSGEFSATVRTKRPDAHFIEYGTIHMAERAPARRTIDAMNGETSGASSKAEGGGHTGNIGG